MPRTPAVGDTVLVAAEPRTNNGSTIAPAIVTRTWSGGGINVRVLLDQDTPPEWRVSITYADVLPDPAAEPDSAWRYRWTWPEHGQRLTHEEQQEIEERFRAAYAKPGGAHPVVLADQPAPTSAPAD